MNLKRIFFVVFAVVWTAVPSYAQHKGKNLAKAVDAALTRQTATQLFAKQKRIYDPVLGYIVPLPPMPPHPQGALSAFVGPLQDPDPGRHLMQVAPLKRPLTNVLNNEAFVRGDLMDPGQLTQAAYLWQLAHPWQELEKYPYLLHKIQDTLNYFKEYFAPYQVEYLPNLQLLKRMLSPGFKALSFAKLLELNPVYPKHITLNEVGFPVKTPQADLADRLDLYLMLSNPREMSAFVNVGEIPGWMHITSYRPFVLTREERAAANQLLARRLDSDKLPANATARDLIEQAYNRLETHAVKYSQVNANTSLDFKAYPNYPNTHLYRSIDGAVIGQWPVIWIQNGRHVLQNPDTVHLIVLNAMMGGVDWHNYQEVSRVLEAFDELCAHVPPTEENIAHLQLLQQNLRIVFGPLIEQYGKQNSKNYTSSKDWHEGNIRYRTWDLLVRRDVRHLVGRNLKYSTGKQ